jgi:hypothetical protein
MEEQECLRGLARRRQCLVPTLRGWLVLVMALGLGVLIVGRSVYGFLAVTKPVPGGLLVVEGWAPDYVMQAAIAEFAANHYDRLMVIGGPLEIGAPLSEYHTTAEMGAAILLRFGMSSNAVQAVPAPSVRQDRTYASGVALREWLHVHHETATKVNLISLGPHARRSWMMLELALGKSFTVGVISLGSKDYDSKHWWRSSAGFRAVVDETVAYVYARVLFRPPKESQP